MAHTVAILAEPCHTSYMDANNIFQPDTYSYDGFVMVTSDGTGHAMTCPALREAEAPRPARFQDGGFDLFCEHHCMEEYLPQSKNPLVAFEAPAPTYGAGPAQKSEPTEDDGDWTKEQVEAWLTDLGRKVEPEDVTPGLRRAATLWADTYEGTFSFMLDMKEAAAKRTLSAGQAKGTLNCWRAELTRRPPVQKGSGSEELDLSGLPAGMYAVPGGDTRLKVQVSKPGSRSKWEGWTFVSDGAEYGSQKRYGKQAPGSIYVGEIQEALKAILADPKGAAAAYGKLTGTCGLCGRGLEDEASVAKGIGPVCEAKFG